MLIQIRWSSQMKSKKNRIRTFVIGGPKNCGYELQRPNTDGHITRCKIRGIALNHKTLLYVNCGIFRKFVTISPQGTVSTVNAHKISKDRNNLQLLPKCERKDYMLVLDKWVVRYSFTSYPFGY